MKYAYFEGQIIPFEDAKIHVMTHAFNYGTGVFEGIRGYWNAEHNQLYILKLKEHYERLFKSCQIMTIKLNKSIDELVAVTLELIRKNNYQEDIYIRPIAYKSTLAIGVRLHKLDDDFLIYLSPFGAYLDISSGINVCVSSWRRISDGMIPARAKVTGVYVNSAFSKTEAALNGYDEAIVLNDQGHVAEGSAENIFIVRDGALITPTVSEDILEGLTRKAVIEIATNEMNLPIIERPIDRTELYIADEIFLVGTGAQVSSVVTVDKRPVNDGLPGSVTKKLQDIYFNAVRGNDPKYQSWLTKAY